jgi:hypothetical protein
MDLTMWGVGVGVENGNQKAKTRRRKLIGTFPATNLIKVCADFLEKLPKPHITIRVVAGGRSSVIIVIIWMNDTPTWSRHPFALQKSSSAASILVFCPTAAERTVLYYKETSTSAVMTL